MPNANGMCYQCWPPAAGNNKHFTSSSSCIATSHAAHDHCLDTPHWHHCLLKDAMCMNERDYAADLQLEVELMAFGPAT